MADRPCTEPHHSGAGARDLTDRPCGPVDGVRVASPGSLTNRPTLVARHLSNAAAVVRDSVRAVRRHCTREKRWRIALECAGHGLVDWDLVRDTTFVCPTFFRSLGYDPNELRGTHEEWVEQLHPAERDEVVEELQRQIRGERDLLEIEYRVRCKDGGYRWVLVRARVVSRDANGSALRMFGTYTDITAAKDAERQLRDLLAEKELLLAEVHHRIKNNMASIVGLLTLHADTLSDPLASAAFSDLERRIQSMHVLYDRLHQSGDYRSVSIADYLTDVVSAVAHTFSYTSMVTVDTDFSSLNCDVDVRIAFPLGLIATELLTNSFKHAFPGCDTGAITVSLAHDGNGAVMLTHSDDGVGMAESSATGSGGGFGMTLVRELADQLGADVTMKSTNGTTVQVAIPRHLVTVAKSESVSESRSEGN